MNETAKVIIGKASRAEAEALRSRVANHGISLALVHNASTCSSGCSTQLEIWAHPDDIASIHEIVNADWHSAVVSNGYDPQLASAVFDSGAAVVTCPACANVFTPSFPECPDCGLQFLPPAESASTGCGPKGCK